MRYTSILSQCNWTTGKALVYKYLDVDSSGYSGLASQSSLTVYTFDQIYRSPSPPLPATMYAFTRLGVAEALAAGPREGMPVKEIAAQVRVHLIQI